MSESPAHKQYVQLLSYFLHRHIRVSSRISVPIRHRNIGLRSPPGVLILAVTSVRVTLITTL